jgi:hypothetical protein
MLNISTMMGQLTNVTYNFGNMEAYDVEHLYCTINFQYSSQMLPIILRTWKPTMLNISTINLQLTNVSYNFGSMKAYNVEHLYNQLSAHKCYL